MDSTLLTGIASVALSLAMEYVPGLSDWYGGLSSGLKATVMAALLTVAAVAVFVLSCYTSQVTVACNEGGFWELARLWVAALVANQATYSIAVKPRS